LVFCAWHRELDVAEKKVGLEKNMCVCKGGWLFYAKHRELEVDEKKVGLVVFYNEQART